MNRDLPLLWQRPLNFVSIALILGVRVGNQSHGEILFQEPHTVICGADKGMESFVVPGQMTLSEHPRLSHSGFAMVEFRDVQGNLDFGMHVKPLSVDVASFLLRVTSRLPERTRWIQVRELVEAARKY